MIGKTISHYKIIEKLDQGGMGVVYIAQDLKLDRKVALKFLPPSYSFDEDAKRRFIHEAKAISSLQHHNICAVHEIDETEDSTDTPGGQLFICMDLYEGETLKQIIEKGPLDIDTIIKITTQIAEGLAKAHEKNIIHRDIKPANIYITNDGIVKILDFGLAKVSSQTQMTMMGTTMGTAAYMSPEQTKGDNVDHRTDIWSLGVLVYEMISSRQPFRGDYEQAIIYSLMNEEPESLVNINSEIPEHLEWIVNKAIEKNPEDRYQNIEELLEHLKGLMDGSSKILIGQNKKIKLLQSTFFTVVIFIALILGYLSLFTDVFDKTNYSSDKLKNSLAVIYFENRTDEVDLEKVLVDMLITNLARHEEINVLSSQRLFDILKNLDEFENDSIKINQNVAAKIAKKANVKTMLFGSIIKIGNTMRITSQLTDVESGEIIASEQANGNKIEDIFKMADELTQKIASNFSLDKGKDKADSLRIADVTTNSYEAYKYYVRGLEDSYQFKLYSAAKYFRTATEHDSTFAMAYLNWAWNAGALEFFNPYSDLREVNKAFELAEHYSYKTTNKERLYIKAIYTADYLFDSKSALSLIEEYVRKYPDDKDALIKQGWLSIEFRDLDKVEQSFNKVLELDPTFADAYMAMAYSYIRLQMDDEAISAAIKYNELQPDNWNTYATMWDMYTQAGRFQDAYKIFENNDLTRPLWNYNIGLLHLLEKDGSKARKVFQEFADLKPDRQRRQIWMKQFIAYSYIFEGNYLAGLNELDDVYKDIKNDIVAIVDLGKLLTIMGNYAKAEKLFFEALRISTNLYSENYNTSKVIINYYLGITQLKSGNINGALKTALDMEQLLEKKNYKSLYIDYVYLLRTEIYLSQNNQESALLEFDKVSKGTKYIFPRAQNLLIETNIIQGNLDLAIFQCSRFYNKVESIHYHNAGDSFDYFYEISKIPYTLGKIYEMKSDNNKAIEHYEEAVKLWKDADKGMFELKDVKTRLAKIKQN